MDIATFLSTPTPLATWRPALVALWYAHRDDWHAAHDALQDAVGSDADWVHAHLHRIEGDLGNAAYWYRRAKQPVAPAALSFADEWAQIAAAVVTPT